MKTITLFRHAKSSWKKPSIPDEKRALNKRGRRDAPFMADIFAALCTERSRLIPDLIASSPARRSVLLAKQLNDALTTINPAMKFKASQALYTFSTPDLLKVITQFDDQLSSVLVVAHNPAITEAINFLCAESQLYIEILPTSGFVSISFATDQWAGAQPQIATPIAYDFPKNYL